VLPEIIPCGSGGGAGLDSCNPFAKEKADRFGLKVHGHRRRRRTWAGEERHRL
jgi:hypothetical protein